MFDWLIVGGGPHGSFAARAIHDVAPDCELAVLDPQGPLDAWQRRAAACGMTYLRSSNAHHLGRRADAMRRFAAEHGYDGSHALGYYRRPSRALFETHALEALSGLPRIPARAETIERIPGGWRVHADDGTAHDTRRLVLATGPNAPYRPPWAGGLAHVYDADFSLGPATAARRRVAVVGGGISGAQLALRARAAGHTVYWVTRRAPERTDFDSDPCYAGPRCLDPFAAAPAAERSRLLAAARQPGTLPPDIYAAITAALAAGELGWRRGHVTDRSADGLCFDDGSSLSVDRVILATGFENHARGDLLADCIRQFDLPIDDDGHVEIDAALQAAPGLHLLGRPASLRLGPMAGNIKGARIGGQRLADVARRQSAYAA